MRGRLGFWISFTALSAFPVAWATAQTGTAPPAATAPPPTAAVQPPAAAVPPPPPVVLPPPLWDPRDAMQLLSFIQQVGSEGLDPVDYDPAGLTVALRSGNPMLLAHAATDRFNLFSSD